MRKRKNLFTQKSWEISHYFTFFGHLIYRFFYNIVIIVVRHALIPHHEPSSSLSVLAWNDSMLMSFFVCMDGSQFHCLNFYCEMFLDFHYFTINFLSFSTSFIDQKKNLCLFWFHKSLPLIFLFSHIENYRFELQIVIVVLVPQIKHIFLGKLEVLETQYPSIMISRANVKWGI